MISLTRVFPRLAMAECFPAFGAGRIFSRAWHGLRVLALSCDWFITLFERVVIRQCDKSVLLL